MQDWPLLATRALTAVVAASSRSGAGHHDERIASAQLQDHFFDTFSGRYAYLDAGSFAARQGGRHHARIVQNPVHLDGADQQRLEGPHRESGAQEQIFDGQRALRHVRRMFEQSHIARHQGGSRKPHHLPARVVPRHDRQHRPQRLIAQITPSRAGGNLFIGQEPLGVFGIIAAGPGGFDNLVDRRLDRFAHLQGHQPAQALLFRLQNLGCTQHPLGAIRKACLPVGSEGFRSQIQLRRQFLVTESRKSLQHFSGCRIHACDGHRSSNSSCRLPAPGVSGPPR